MNELYKKLQYFGSVKANISLSRFSTFKIGGPAQFLVEIKENSKLIQLLDFLNEQGLEFFILGGGSNILFPDEGLHKIVIKINTLSTQVTENMIEVDSGVLLSTLVNLAVKNGLSGLEWAAGIPGTVGGAIRGNAGAMGENMGECIQEVSIWQDGQVSVFDKKECQFSYRESFFKKNPQAVILKAKIKLPKGEKKEILEKISRNLSNRKKNSTLPSAGSFFKNIRLEDWPGKTDILPELFKSRGTVPAGWLIENCGLKGFKIGGAGISQEHGNFLVNFGSATADQVLQVVEEVQKKVYNEYGVGLEPEVQIEVSR